MSDTSQSLPLVVHVLPVLQPAGAERVVAELAKRLPSRGFRTMVVCLEDPTAPIGQELTAAGVDVRGLRISRRRTLKCAAELRKILPSDRPLIIHSQLIHANLAARLAAPDDAIVISTVQVAERRFRPWHFWLDRLTAHRSAVEVCVARSVADFQRSKTGLPESFFHVIDNGVDLSRLAVRQTPILSGGSAHVVSVGRLNSQKDFPTLLRAWSRVERAVPTARLTIAGDGPQRDSLKSLTGSLRLKNAHFAGFVNDIPSLLIQGDIYVQSSAWEGTPLALAEAMGAELAPVVTNVDSMPDMVAHERSGLVVEKGQPQLLADAIKQLISNPDRARAMAANARDEAHRRFNVDRMVDRYAELYRRLICSRP
jgi:glycosyltransferase involved in cell wall biosynthesis